MQKARGTVDLSGIWLTRSDPKDLGELYPGEMHYTHAGTARWMRSDLDEQGWTPVNVPGRWDAAGHDPGEIAWYRRRFDASPAHGERLWLNFTGVDYIADVWLNEVYLGSHEGQFGRFGWEVTDLCATESNVLAVRVHNPRDADGERHELGQLKRYARGALARWDMNDPETNPGGIWAPVELVSTNRAVLTELITNASPDESGPFDPSQRHPATIDVTLKAVSDRSETGTLTLRVINEDGLVEAKSTTPVPLSPTTTTTTLRLRLSEARLWWTWDLGDPALYRIEAQLSVDEQLLDSAEVVTGVRSLHRDTGSSLYLNGHRIFQRGANYLASQQLSSITAAEYATDVRLAREANLNTLHPFCIVERQAFYDACDQAGLLVYQDLPIWLMSDTSGDLVRRLTTQVNELVTQFGQHPSIAIWNVGSQPSPANVDKSCSALTRHIRAADPTRVVQHANASFSYDHSQPTHASRSFFWPTELGAEFQRRHDWRYDTHIYAGWYFGTPQDLRDLPTSHYELVTEFGAQALPRVEALREMLGEAAYPPQWPAYARRCCQPQLMASHLDRHTSLEDMVTQSQAYQADVLRQHIEFYRTRKYRPCNGAHVFAFVDCWPAITWSILEHDRTPKLGYHTVAMAMAPLQAFLTGVVTASGGGHRVRITLVNDHAGVSDVGLLLRPLTHPPPELYPANEEAANAHAAPKRRVVTVDHFEDIDVDVPFDPLERGLLLTVTDLHGDQIAENSYTRDEADAADRIQPLP